MIEYVVVGSVSLVVTCIIFCHHMNAVQSQKGAYTISSDLYPIATRLQSNYSCQHYNMLPMKLSVTPMRWRPDLKLRLPGQRTCLRCKGRKLLAFLESAGGSLATLLCKNTCLPPWIIRGGRSRFFESKAYGS